MCMRKELPPWVEKYRETGTTFRKRGDGYAMFKVSSTYVKGKKYPKLNQEYLGVVYKEGFVPKKIDVNIIAPLEFGLSNFIYSHFKRDLFRTCFNYKTNGDEIIKISIIKYIFSEVKKEYLIKSKLTNNSADLLFDLYNKISIKRFDTIVNKIQSLMMILFKNENNINEAKTLLLLSSNDNYSSDVVSFFERNNIKL